MESCTSIHQVFHVLVRLIALQTLQSGRAKSRYELPRTTCHNHSAMNVATTLVAFISLSSCYRCFDRSKHAREVYPPGPLLDYLGSEVHVLCREVCSARMYGQYMLCIIACRRSLIYLKNSPVYLKNTFTLLIDLKPRRTRSVQMIILQDSEADPEKQNITLQFPKHEHE